MFYICALQQSEIVSFMYFITDCNKAAQEQRGLNVLLKGLTVAAWTLTILLVTLTLMQRLEDFDSKNAL